MKLVRRMMAWLLVSFLLCGNYGSSVLAAENILDVVERSDGANKESGAEALEGMDNVLPEGVDDTSDAIEESVSDNVEDSDNYISECNEDELSYMQESEESMKEVSSLADMDEWLALNVDERLAAMSSEVIL